LEEVKDTRKQQQQQQQETRYNHLNVVVEEEAAAWSKAALMPLACIAIKRNTCMSFECTQQQASKLLMRMCSELGLLNVA